MNLVDRFERLMTESLGAERIDALVTPANDVPGLQRADYLIDRRSIIVEQKALESDPQEKIDAEVERLSARDDWPLFFGKAQLSDATHNMPDADEIMQRVFVKVSRSVEKAFTSADKQIRDTRQLLSLPDYTPGILVLLNEQIETIGPDVVKHRLAQLFHARDESGGYRYPNVALVLLFTEAHVILDAERSARAPVMTFEGPSSLRHPALVAYAGKIVDAWAAAHGWGVEHTDFDEIDSRLQRKSDWSTDHAPQLKRHELWRRNYRAGPYLAGLADEDLLEHGRRLLSAMNKHYRAGASTLPLEASMEVTQGWTHFLEEASSRGIDLRRLGPVTKKSAN